MHVRPPPAGAAARTAGVARGLRRAARGRPTSLLDAAVRRAARRAGRPRARRPGWQVPAAFLGDGAGAARQHPRAGAGGRRRQAHATAATCPGGAATPGSRSRTSAGRARSSSAGRPGEGGRAGQLGSLLLGGAGRRAAWCSPGTSAPASPPRCCGSSAALLAPLADRRARRSTCRASTRGPPTGYARARGRGRLQRVDPRGAAAAPVVPGAARGPGPGGGGARVSRREGPGRGRRARQLALSNLDKVLYPADGFTKGEVIDYYTRIAPVLLPHLAGRRADPQALPGRRGGASVLREERPAPHAGLGARRCAAAPRLHQAPRDDRLRRRRGAGRAGVAGQPRAPGAARAAVAGRGRRRGDRPTCWCSTSTPARPRRSWSAARSRCCCASGWAPTG